MEAISFQPEPLIVDNRRAATTTLSLAFA